MVSPKAPWLFETIDAHIKHTELWTTDHYIGYTLWLDVDFWEVQLHTRLMIGCWYLSCTIIYSVNCVHCTLQYILVYTNIL